MVTNLNIGGDKWVRGLQERGDLTLEESCVVLVQGYERAAQPGAPRSWIGEDV